MKRLFGAALLAVSSAAGAAETAEDEAAARLLAPTAPLRVTGSSTVAPFALVAASRTENAKISVETSGTTAGLAALCAARGPGQGGAALAGASRPVRPAELDACSEAGVSTVVEVTLGQDALVFAQAADNEPLMLDAATLFRAVAARWPRSADDCTLTPNRVRTWADVSPSLPARPILVYGPPATSGSGETLSRLALAPGARAHPCLAALEEADPAAFAEALAVDTGGRWIATGESDGATAFALTRLKNAVGIMGLVHAQREEGLAILPFGGVPPTTDTIAAGQYALARPLFVYTTAGQLTGDPRVIDLVRALRDGDATGPDGILTKMGLASEAGAGSARLISTGTGEATPMRLGD